MGPSETLQDVTERYYKQLKREGLNPFDLLSWTYLKSLYLCVRASGRRAVSDQYGPSDWEIHRNTKQAIWAALERKAEAIALDTGTDDTEHELEELRSL